MNTATRRERIARGRYGSGVPDVIRLSDLALSETASRFEGADHGATISFFVTRHPNGGGPSLHRHPYEETFVLRRGVAEFTVGGETIEARAGDVVVVPANTPHRFRSIGDEDLEQLSIHLAPRMVQEWLE